MRYDLGVGLPTLRQVLQGVASGYSARDGGAGQTLLEQAQSSLNPAVIPAGWAVKCSRRIGRFTETPWLGFFDPDETTDPKVGLYVCWIFEPDLEHVVLSIQQGTESLTRATNLGSTIPERLRSDAQVLRDALETTLIRGLTDPISFGPGRRQRRYAAGSVAHQRFAVSELPDEDSLVRLQERFCDLLGEIIAARAATLQTSPGTLNQSLPPQKQLNRAQLEHFKPKSADDYLVRLGAATDRRHRRHEAMVNAFSAWSTSRGWTVASPHPVDLRLRRGAATREGAQAWTNAIMFEAKIVSRGNVTAAVREAIGQLHTYPYLVVPEEVRSTIRLAALFSESVGDLWEHVLENELRIATIWWENGDWRGGPLAHSRGIVG